MSHSDPKCALELLFNRALHSWEQKVVRSRGSLSKPWMRPEEIRAFLLKVSTLVEGFSTRLVEVIPRGEEVFYVCQLGGDSVEGRKVCWSFAGRARFSGNEIVALTANTDLISLFKQLGTLPDERIEIGLPPQKPSQDDPLQLFLMSEASGWAAVLCTESGHILEANSQFKRLCQCAGKDSSLSDFLTIRDKLSDGQEVAFQTGLTTMDLRVALCHRFRDCDNQGMVFLAFAPSTKIGRAIRFLAEERAGLSREIHDGVAQDSAALRLLIISDRDRQTLSTVAGRLAVETRGLTYRLQGAKSKSLHDMLRELVEKHRSEDSLEVELRISCSLSLSEPCRLVVFRVVQEALRNIVVHSGARLATVSIVTQGEKLQCEIADSGKGTTALRPDRFGVRGMKERCELVGGQFEIDSSPGRGTLVRICIPLREKVFPL